MTQTNDNSSVCPYVQCSIQSEEITLLVYTGATVSILSKDTVDVISKKNPKITQLPIMGTLISNAVSKEICKSTSQIFCACYIGNVVILSNFLQIENLNQMWIIGTDILHKYVTQLKFNNHTIYHGSGEYCTHFTVFTQTANCVEKI